MTNNENLTEKVIYDNILDLTIKALNHNIIIKPNDENSIQIFYDKDIENEISVSINNNSLTVKGILKFNFFKTFINFKYRNIYIYIPQRLINLIVKDINANIWNTVENIENLKIKDINGNCYVKSENISSLNIKDINGNLEIVDSNIANLTIKDVNGNLQTDSIDVLETYINDVNGNLILDFNDLESNYNIYQKKLLSNHSVNNNAQKNITIKSVSGNIDLYFAD